MPNVTISDLPDAITPLDDTTVFFEVQAIENGIDVSRRVRGDMITFNVFPPPTVEGSIVRGDLVAGTYLETLLVNVGDNTDNSVNIDGVANGGAGSTTLRINAPVGQDAVIQLQEGNLGTFRMFYDSTFIGLKQRLNNPGSIQLEEGNGTVVLAQFDSITGQQTLWAGTLGTDVPVARTVLPASGGMEVDNQVTGAGFERVLTTSDAGGGGLPAGAQFDMAYISTAPGTYSATSAVQVEPGVRFEITDNMIIDKTDPRLTFSAGGADGYIIYDDQFFGGPTLDMFINGTEQVFRAADSTTSALTRIWVAGQTDAFIDMNASIAPFIRLQAASTKVGPLTTAAATYLEVDSGGAFTSRLELANGAPASIIEHDNAANTVTFGRGNSGGGALSSATLQLDIDVVNSTAHILVAGTEVARGAIAANGGFEVNNLSTGAGFERVLTTSDIGGVSFPIDAADNDQIRWGTGQDMLQFFDGTDMQFNAVDGVDFRFLGGTAGAEAMLTLISNGGLLAFFNGNQRFEVDNNGILLRGSLATNPNTGSLQDAEIRLGNSGGTNIAQIGFGTGGASLFRIISSNQGALFELQGLQAGGALREYFRADADNNVTLFNPGSDEIVAVTDSAANGGLTVDNQATGAGLERVLTESDLAAPLGGVKTATQTVTSSTTLVDATDLSAPLQPSASYILEATLIFAGQGATANGFRWGLDFNGQIANLDTLFGGSFSWQQSGAVESIVDAGSSGTFQTKTTFDSAGVRETVKISLGIITQSDYVADTNVDIQFAQGTSNATGTDLEEGSWLKVTRIA